MLRSVLGTRFLYPRTLLSIARGRASRPVMADEEIQCLSKYAAGVSKLLVEIGTYNGGSASFLSKVLPSSARMVTIDPYIPDSMNPQMQGALSASFLNVLLHGNISKVKFYKKYSWQVVQNWREPIDLLWIDGSHHYDDVKKDFEQWSPFLKKGGHLISHDSNDHNVPLVKRRGPTVVCDEIKASMASACRHLEAVKSVNVFLKN